AQVFVVVGRTFDRRDQRRGTAAGSQAQIDSKTSRRQNFGKPFAQPRGRLRTVGRARGLVQINQIDVGAEIQLAPAQFAHRQNAEGADRARAYTQKSSRQIECRADAFVGQ